ncbi:hypothetical protein ACOBWA_08565 [Psychrobacter sp. ER1]|uniref:hypothetical protein n=1 Tax=Psychrobacter sp. ER1 TaxID=3406645 RepID=UPI003B43401B
MRNDRTAHLSLVHDTEKNHVPQHEVAAANRAAIQRRHENNMRFWKSIRSLVFVISCAALVIYTLIHFA